MAQETFQEIGTRLGALVTEKNAAYGSSFEVAPQIMALLYQNGISLAQLADALLVVRIIDKLMRIATDRDALGENPFEDLGGYGICGSYMHQEKKAPCNTNVRIQAAKSSRAVATASAARRTGKRSTSGSCKSSATTSKRGANAARRAASSTPKRKR
jgi:hypothetical protein